MLVNDSGTTMDAAPINPDWVISGDPKARCRPVASSGGTSSGYWDCTQGVFRWHYSVDEAVLILDGGVRFRDLNDPHLRPVQCAMGSSILFPAGAVIEWTVPNYVRKFYVLSDPRRSLLQRIYRRLHR